MEQPPGGGEPRKAEQSSYDEAALNAEMGESRFISFQNNFYWLVPGGKHKAVIEVAKEAFNQDPAQAEEVNRDIEKKAADVEAIINTMQPSPKPDLIAAIAAGKWDDAEAIALLRRIYIAMRNRGYSHEDLSA